MKIHLYGWRKSNIVVFSKSRHGGKPQLYQSQGSGDELGHVGQKSECGACVEDVLSQREFVRDGLDKLGMAK